MVVLAVDAPRTSSIRDTIEASLRKATLSNNIMMGKRRGMQILVTLRDKNSADINLLTLERFGISAKIVS